MERHWPQIFPKLTLLHVTRCGWGGERGARLGPPPFRRCCEAPFSSFALSFCIVLLWVTLEPRLISSEASHMIFKIKQKLWAKAPKCPWTTCFGVPFWEFASGPLILISTSAFDTFELNLFFDEIIDAFSAVKARKLCISS